MIMIPSLFAFPKVISLIIITILHGETLNYSFKRLGCLVVQCWLKRYFFGWCFVSYDYYYCLLHRISPLFHDVFSFLIIIINVWSWYCWQQPIKLKTHCTHTKPMYNNMHDYYYGKWEMDRWTQCNHWRKHDDYYFVFTQVRKRWSVQSGRFLMESRFQSVFEHACMHILNCCVSLYLNKLLSKMKNSHFLRLHHHKNGE